MSPTTQFVELEGIRFIGLGAVVDELTPRQRVYDTLEVSRTKSERLVTIGYLLDKESPLAQSEPPSRNRQQEKRVETVPLHTWLRDCPDERIMAGYVKTTVDFVDSKQFTVLADYLSKHVRRQKKSLLVDANFFLVGISVHNLAVAKILAGDDTDADSLLREAIELKSLAFGREHAEVALSQEELGIQLFAGGDFLGAKSIFEDVFNFRSKIAEDTANPKLAMTLNNIACCDFQLGNYTAALQSMENARSIQHHADGSSVHDELDLLHVAIVYANCGYLNLALKQYDEARSILEEALLIQQSVLNDNHRAVRDTLSNIEFTNAFHS